METIIGFTMAFGAYHLYVSELADRNRLEVMTAKNARWEALLDKMEVMVSNIANRKRL